MNLLGGMRSNKKIRAKWYCNPQLHVQIYIHIKGPLQRMFSFYPSWFLVNDGVIYIVEMPCLLWWKSGSNEHMKEWQGLMMMTSAYVRDTLLECKSPCKERLTFFPQWLLVEWSKLRVKSSWHDQIISTWVWPNQMKQWKDDHEW